jgi:hypothetical protein
MPIGCRLLPFPPALRNKQHARAVAFALARRLAGIPDGDMHTGGVAAYAKFLPRPDKAIRRPAFQFFIAHRAAPPRFSTDTFEATLSFAAKSPASHTYPQSAEKFPQFQGCWLGEAFDSGEGRSPPRRAPTKAGRRHVDKPEERSKVGIIHSHMVGTSCTVAPHGERRTDRNVCATQGKSKRTAHRQECLCYQEQDGGVTGGSRGGG